MTAVTKEAAVGVLSGRGWLSLTAPAFRRAVLDRISLHELVRGDSVYRIGDPPGGLWAIVDGEVEVEIPGPESAPSLAHFATPGFWFGEGALIYPTPRRVGVFAARPSVLGSLALGDCRHILDADPSAWRWIALLSTMSLDLAIRLSADLMLRDPAKRTAAMLLRLSGLRNGMFLPATNVPISLSQEKLGRLANLSRNAIGPILRDFVARGLVNIRYRTITVMDDAGLAAVIAEETAP